jgi:hypothetical protein
MKRRLVCITLVSFDPYGDVLDAIEIHPRTITVRRFKKAMRAYGAFTFTRINTFEQIEARACR